MKKVLSVFTALVMIFCLTSCTGGSSSDEKTLTLMGKTSDVEKSYLTKIIEMYEETTGNKIDIISFEDNEYEEEAAEEFKDGNAPDLFLHFNNSSLNNFDIPNNFHYMDNEAWVSDLADISDSYCRDSEGNLLGLPFWEGSISGCYYNKKLLGELGLKPAATQAEFDVLCQALKAIGYTPICWPADGCNWQFQFGLDPIFCNDPSQLEKINRNEITFADIPAVHNMIQWFSDAADKGWFGSSYLDNGWSDISPVMGSGEAVMIFIWDTWFYTDFEEGNKYSKDDFALMPVFMNTEDTGTYEGPNLNMMMVNKNSQKLDMALDFINFCATPENYNKAFDGVSTISCFKGQTTNIQSQMVTDAMASIQEHQHVSTAEPKIIGYVQDEVGAAVTQMVKGKTDVKGCIQQMDNARIAAAKKLGTEHF